MEKKNIGCIIAGTLVFGALTWKSYTCYSKYIKKRTEVTQDTEL